METTATGLTLFFDENERDTARLVHDTCEQSTRLLREHWGLETPPEVRVYVMTSWLHFVFHSAPWYWQPLLVLCLPLWYFRVRNLWQVAGGWAQSYGKRKAIGVKPPRLIQLANKGLGERIFVGEDKAEDKIRHITCHELTHAFTAHLRLPMWLNEGLAMLMVDRLLKKPTVKAETLDILARSTSDKTLARVGRITEKNQDAVVTLYVRGYWIVRYLEEKRPDLLRGLLAQRYSHVELESKIASSLDIDYGTFWNSIDGMIISHFA
jgi:hypothetical protein